MNTFFIYLTIKFNSKDDVDTNNQLPTTINIQLEPKTESAYCRVHRLAQNPFLTIEVPTLQSIKYLIEFLENKWKTRRNQFVKFTLIYFISHNNTNKENI